MPTWSDKAREYRETHPDAVRREYCEHGLELRRSALEGQAFAGPIGFCECHQASFGYIDSGWMSGDGRAGGISNDKHLCKPCGGQAHKYGDQE